MNNSFLLFLNSRNSYTMTRDSIVISIVNYITHTFQCDDHVITIAYNAHYKRKVR